MTEYAHDNTEAINKFIDIVENYQDYSVHPDVILSSCEFCGINKISGLGYVNERKDSYQNYVELEIRKGYPNEDLDSYCEDYYFVCLNCAVFYSDREDDLKELLDIKNKYRNDDNEN